MNTTYLIITGIILLYGIIQLSTGGFNSHNFPRWFSTLTSLVTGTVMLIVSFIGYTGEDLIEINPATNTRVENELVIQSEGCPTQVVNRIDLIDKNVQIKKVTKRNAWGDNMFTNYEVEEVKGENYEKEN